MKKIFFLFSALLIIGAIYSCKKNNNSSKNDDTQDLLKTTANIGKYHNSGMAYVIGNLNKSNRLKTTSTSAEAPTSLEVYQQAAAYVSSLGDYLALATTPSPNLIQNLQNAASINNVNDLQIQWTSSVNSVSTSGLIITTREQGMVAEIEQVLVNASNQLSNTENHNVIKEKLNSIKVKYSNTVYNANEGELFNGLLSIASSSNDFNFDYLNTGQSVNGPPPPDKSLANVIAADALGYIWGWGKAVYEDSKKPGGIQKSGENERIKQGLIGAIQASSMKLLPVKTTVPPTVIFDPKLNSPKTISDYLKKIGGSYELKIQELSDTAPIASISIHLDSKYIVLNYIDNQGLPQQQQTSFDFDEDWPDYSIKLNQPLMFDGVIFNKVFFMGDTGLYIMWGENRYFLSNNM
ncbi:hypothetical protein G7092_11085 [Mucilaginibacter sp. HC2]|uniref:hypothetical protein n=1 Tax=Mucilaginibacter inviolabilis TaxID=2714892 RepID=UPI00140D2DC9|nr:hypothetical protein [Mucilaginibacter inviolabilis]NHA04345.1 hypothetical protein [Mucilaginibacter inviolabilis]